MRSNRIASFILAIFLVLAPVQAANAADNQLTAEEKSGGWMLLFDGKSLDGWGALGKKEGWAVEDGAIACMVKGGNMAYSTGEYKDFILQCDFKTNRDVNSGIFIRWEDLNDPVQTGMEIQILDCFAKEKPDKHDCGALYDIMPPSIIAVKPAGEWNHIEITCQGPILRVVLNDQQIIHLNLSAWTEPNKNPDGTRNKFRRAYSTMINKGHIGFQDHGGRCWYKNIKLKELPEYHPAVPG